VRSEAEPPHKLVLNQTVFGSHYLDFYQGFAFVMVDNTEFMKVIQ